MPQSRPAQGFPAVAAAPAPAGRPDFGDEPGYAPAGPDAPKPAGAPRRRTGLVVTTPVITANSNSPRTAAMRRFCVAGAAPRRSDNRTTVEPQCAWAGSASPDSRTSRSAAPRPDQRLPGEEPQEVQHVKGVRAPRRPGEVPALQVRQKPVHHRDVVALPSGDFTGKQEDVSVAGYSKPHRHLQAGNHRPPVSAPTSLAGGTSPAPSVSRRGPVNG